MKLKHFYSVCKKSAEINTPDVLEAVLKAPIYMDIDESSIKPRKKNMRLKQYVTAACLIIVFSSISILLNSMKQQLPSNNNPPVVDNFVPSPQPNPSNNQDDIVTNLVEGEHEDNVILSNGELYFNQIEKTEFTKMKLPEGAYISEIRLEEYISYLGSDPRPVWVLEDMEQSERPVRIWYDQNGDIFDSSWVFHYSSDFENSKAKRIEIGVEKRKIPTTDIIILGEQKVSSINNTEIIMGHTIMDKNHESNKDLYYAEFINNGIGYRVTAEGGVTQEEFIKVLQSIIDK